MDRIEIEILEDGTIKCQTSSISQKNHMSADEFLDMVEDLAGGTRSRKAAKVQHSMAFRNRDRQLKTFQK